MSFWVFGLLLWFFVSFFSFLFSCLFRAAPTTYGGSWVKGWIKAVATGLHHSHSNARSELHLRPIPQLTAVPDPLTHWARPGGQTRVLMVTSQLCYHWATVGTPSVVFLTCDTCIEAVNSHYVFCVQVMIYTTPTMLFAWVGHVCDRVVSSYFGFCQWILFANFSLWRGQWLLCLFLSVGLKPILLAWKQ